MSDNLESTLARRSGQPRQRDTLTAPQLEALVARAKEGDLLAFQELYRGYARRILNYVYRLTGSREEAEDLTQEAFILAHKNLGSLKENSKFQSWLYRIAQNSVYQKYRASPPRMESIDDKDQTSEALELPSSDKTPEEAILSQELRRVVQRVISELPEKYRQVFILSAVDKHSYEAITEIVGRSLASVKSDIHRARLEVRDRVKKYLGDRYGMSDVS